jgi:hypothetical protein
MEFFDFTIELPDFSPVITIQQYHGEIRFRADRIIARTHGDDEISVSFAGPRITKQDQPFSNGWRGECLVDQAPMLYAEHYDLIWGSIVAVAQKKTAFWVGLTEKAAAKRAEQWSS